MHETMTKLDERDRPLRKRLWRVAVIAGEYQ